MGGGHRPGTLTWLPMDSISLSFLYGVFYYSTSTLSYDIACYAMIPFYVVLFVDILCHILLCYTMF